MSYLFAVLVVLLFASCIAGFVLMYVFLYRLRTQFTQAWKALGEPTLILNNSVKNSFATMRFLWRREYVALGNSRFSRFAGFLRTYMVCYLVLFIAVFVLTFVVKG
jgi:hypothetical protein